MTAMPHTVTARADSALVEMRREAAEAVCGCLVALAWLVSTAPEGE